MTPNGEMLIVADRLVADEFASRLAPSSPTARSDPYEALQAMRDRPWPLIVLTAPQPDLAGFCQAVRRLQRDARVMVLCAPAAEPQVRPLVGDTLDDYFIYPLMESDWRKLLGKSD